MPIIKRDRIEEKGTLELKGEEVKAPPGEFLPPPPAVEIPSTVSEEAVESYKEQAQKMISDAQAQANDIISRAREETEKIKESARAEGFEEGKSQGSAQFGEKTKEALETVNQAVKERKKIIKDAEAEILRLALKTAEQIIRSEVSMHRDVCMNIVSEAISRVGDRENVVVKVNRDDLEQVKKDKNRLAGVLDGIKNFSVVDDSQVEPGGCVIETNLGFVDARISTKITAIADALKKVQSSGSEEE